MFFYCIQYKLGYTIPRSLTFRPTKTMYASQVNIRNFKNIHNITFECDEHLNRIAGNNWAGKTSLIDAIFFAIQWADYYGRGKDVSQLVTKWETQWSVTITFKSTGKQYIVSRDFDSQGRSTIKITSTDWEKISAAEAKSWLSDFTIDPLMFMNKSKKDMFDIIKQVAWINTKEIDESIDIAVESRKAAWYDSDSKKKTVEQLAETPFETSLMDAWELSEELSKAINHNNLVKNKELELSTTRAKYQQVTWEIEQLEKRLADLKAQQSDLSEKWKSLSNEMKTLQLIDTDSISIKINSIDEHNKKYYAYQRYTEAKKSYEDALQVYKELDEHVEQLRKEKMQVITTAKYPIDWMVLDEENGVLINGIPFDQFSSGQQLVHAIKLAQFWLNKPIKIVWIKNGALLDTKALEFVCSQNEFVDYQMFIELVWEEHADAVILKQWDIAND